MRIVKQDFWNQYKCIADKCPATCCSGWQIMVDDDSMKKFEKYEGPYKANINNSIDWIDNCILQTENGDCAFLSESGLCDLIINEGERMLCDTCRLYPRHVEEYEDLREWCMSLSCPEIARIVVESERSTSFIIEDNDDDDPLEEEFEEFDLILFTKFQDSRDTIFKILQHNKLSIEKRMGLILEFAEELQVLYDEDEVFMMDEIIKKYTDESFLYEHAEEFEISFSGFVRDDFKVLYDLEFLSDDWEDYLKTIEYYPYDKADSIKDFIEGVDKDRHELIIENILVSLLYTYYLGGIYNGMIYAYTQMCIFSVIAMDSLALASYIKSGKKVPLNEYEKIVYKFSRETEHSDINIGTFLEYFDL